MIPVLFVDGELSDDSELQRFCRDIIECFEDFLDRRGIIIENMDYAELEDCVTDILHKWDLIERVDLEDLFD